MKKHKLLFVDDENNILKSLKRLFAGEEYDILTASSGYEGLEILEKNKISLILSDYRMPELNGVEFLKLAKERSPETIRLILTGFADVSVAISAINEGEVYKFITKPWESDTLNVLIKRSIEHYELVCQRNELLETVKKQNDELKNWNENLEKIVEDKTKELNKAYGELQLKVKELEGKDKILQYLLTIHSFEDTMNLILEVILDVIVFDKIVIYTSDMEKRKMAPTAGMLVKDSKKSEMGAEIKRFPVLPIPDLKDKLILEGASHLNKINEYSYFIPIEKDNNCLGVILVDNTDTKKSIAQKELKILAGFSSLAALAINENLISSTLPEWEDQIKDVLEELK